MHLPEMKKCSRDVPFGTVRLDRGRLSSSLFQIATIRAYVKCLFLKASNTHKKASLFLKFCFDFHWSLWSEKLTLLYAYSGVDIQTGVGERRTLLRKVRPLHGYISQCSVLSYLPLQTTNKWELHKLYLARKLLSNFLKYLKGSLTRDCGDIR